jgi:hypothetical protein
VVFEEVAMGRSPEVFVRRAASLIEGRLLSPKLGLTGSDLRQQAGAFGGQGPQLAARGPLFLAHL